MAKQDLLAIGQRIEEHRRELAKAMADARPAVREAVEAGMSISAIAECLGVTRQSIYNFLEE